MNPMLHFHHADSADELARALARYVAERLRQALDQRGQALLIVSGGSTPVPFFEALSLELLDWHKVFITLADERWVDASHADSNERLVCAHLLKHEAEAACFVPLYNGAATAQEGLPQIAARLEAVPWPADVTILGMGGDGHTASLFPHGPDLAAALDDTNPARCVAVGVPSAPNVPVARVSLSRRCLLDTAELVVHVTGESKQSLLREAMREGPVVDMPIRLALHQSRVPCHVFQSR
jgi:6-phosphogluconolactonase